MSRRSLKLNYWMTQTGRSGRRSQCESSLHWIKSTRPWDCLNSMKWDNMGLYFTEFLRHAKETTRYLFAFMK